MQDNLSRNWVFNDFQRFSICRIWRWDVMGNKRRNWLCTKAKHQGVSCCGLVKPVKHHGILQMLYLRKLYVKLTNAALGKFRDSLAANRSSLHTVFCWLFSNLLRNFDCSLQGKSSSSHPTRKTFVCQFASYPDVVFAKHQLCP